MHKHGKAKFKLFYIVQIIGNMPKITGFLLDADYVDEHEKSVIRLFIKTENGHEIVKDHSFKPYFYAIVENPEKDSLRIAEDLKGILREYEIVEKKLVINENPKKVLKLIFDSTRMLVEARARCKELSYVIERREYKLPFARRYLIDKNLTYFDYIEFTVNENNGIEKIEKLGDKPVKLNIGVFDLETLSPERFSNPQLDPILMASFGTETWTKVICEKLIDKDYAIKVRDEKELVEKIVSLIKENDLDILGTYNGDSFDIPYIKTRAEKLKTRVKIGLDGSEPMIKRKGMDNAVLIKGLQHVDAYLIVRILARLGVVNLIKFDLESVSEAIFGEWKEKIKAEEINQIWNSNKGLERLANYNKEDSEVTFKILKNYLPIFVELSKLVKQNLYDTTRAASSTLVENLLVLESINQGVLIPNDPEEGIINQRMLQTYVGGFVKEPESGLHENIAVLDFSSLHPTIMISHNISPDTLDCGHEECKKNIAPNNHYFCTKKPGFLSKTLKELFDKRIKLKEMVKKMDKDSMEYKVLNAQQTSLKIILNATYGSLGYARFKWYSRECASAVTGLSRQYAQMVGEEAVKAGFKWIYGDSITKERFVPIIDKSGLIKVMNIEKLFLENKEKARGINEKEVISLEGYKTLSINQKTLKPEWKRINEIIRHKTNKKIFKINQKYGETRVTENHSLIIKEGNQLKEVKPQDLNNKALTKIKEIPKGKNVLEIDLFEELKDYNYDILYKDRIKINQVHKDGGYIWFGWNKQKNPVKLKRYIRTDSKEFKALCKLFGAYIAEGSSSTIETSTRNGASISSSDVEWLMQLQKDYYSLFSNAKCCIIPSQRKIRELIYKNKNKTKSIRYADKTHKMQMMNNLAAILFKVMCGQKSHAKKLPYFIFNVPDEYKKILLDEYLKGDGSRKVNEKLGYSKEYKKNNFRSESKSLELTSGLSMLLTQLGQNHIIRYRKDKQTYIIQTSSKHNKRLKTEIKEQSYKGYVYDLSVEENNNFVDCCGLILLHNTDSAFLEIPKNRTKEDVTKFVDGINDKLPGVMNLELEGFYKRGIFVTKKGNDEAAKKKYALMDEKGRLKIVGFEYVRRDWARIAKDTQRKVIEAVLKEGDSAKAINIVKETLDYLKSGKAKKEELVIYTQIKRKLKDYESIGPHVAAAKKAIQKGKSIEIGSVIEYIVTKNGKSISDRAELAEFVKEGNYDADYYISHQVLPAVIKIMQELGHSEDDLKHGGKQKTLQAFFG